MKAGGKGKKEKEKEKEKKKPEYPSDISAHAHELLRREKVLVFF